MACHATATACSDKQEYASTPEKGTVQMLGTLGIARELAYTNSADALPCQLVSTLCKTISHAPPLRDADAKTHACTAAREAVELMPFWAHADQYSSIQLNSRQ